MGERRIDGFFDSSNGSDRVAYSIYRPEGKPKAVVQIAHGMSEHFGRYEEFAGFLRERGFLVCGNDHLGHGYTAPTTADLGYFGPEKGWIHMTDDMYRLTSLVKAEEPGLPYFVLGHSMGSMLTRAYLTCYGKEIQGAVLIGTSGTQNATRLVSPLVKGMLAVKGDRYTSLTLYVLAFGSYNKKYDKAEGRIAWMSQDREVLRKFKEDPRCNFYFTVSGFWNLYELVQFISRKEWAEEVPRDLPVLLLSGDMDPVGKYGRGVEQVYRRLKRAGIDDLHMTLYPGLRHEILNEPGREQVWMDILNWLERRVQHTY